MACFQRHLRAPWAPCLLSVVTDQQRWRHQGAHLPRRTAGTSPDGQTQSLHGIQVPHVLLVHPKIWEQHCLLSQAGLALHGPASVKSPLNPWKTDKLHTAFARKDKDDFCLAANVIYCPLWYQPVLCPVSGFFFCDCTCTPTLL